MTASYGIMHGLYRPSCTCSMPATVARHMIATRTSLARRSRRGSLQVVAVGWDPEGILPAPKAGHISRRMLQKQVEQNEELKMQMEKAREEARRELTEKREARTQPTSHAELIEYMLDTEGEEMTFEVARCRPLLTQEFFAYLKEQIAEQRFAKVTNEGRLAELESLQEFLEPAIKALDEVTAKAAEPAERVRKLLQSPDKRATLIQMAGDNEIDQPLLDLLQQNIAAAKAAGQDKPAEFMQKVHDAARRYLITV